MAATDSLAFQWTKTTQMILFGAPSSWKVTVTQITLVQSVTFVSLLMSNCVKILIKSVK